MVRPKNRSGVVTLSGFRRSRRAVAYEEILCAGMDKPSRSKVRALPIALQRGLRGLVPSRFFDLVWRYPPRDVAHLACAKRGKVSSGGFGTRDVEEVRDRMANQKKPLCLPGS
jgi:hypothetical protein